MSEKIPKELIFNQYPHRRNKCDLMKQKSNSENNNGSAKKRGIFLYFMIIFGVVTVLVKVFSVIALASKHSNLIISPSGSPAIDLFSTALLVVALIGIWKWKKWGAYLVFIRLAFTMIVQFFIYQSLGLSLIAGYNGTFNFIADVAGAGLWVLALYRKWSYFE